jgi:hypothetical protein
MLRNLALIVAAAPAIVLTATLVPAAEFGTADEAKAMLERAVAALK